MSVDITRLTAHLSPEQQDEVKRAYRRRHENSTAAFLWCFFFGTLGAHRFYLKQWGGGFLRLLVPLIAAAVVVAGIVANLQATIVVAVVIVLLLIALLWEIIDLFRIDHEVYTRNLKLAEDLIAGALLKDKSVERRADAKMEGLMLQAQSEARTGAEAERREVAGAAAAAVPAVAATVADREPAPASGEEDEAVGAAEARSSEAAGVAHDTYVERDVTEISDDPNATQHAARYAAGPQNDWSTTETIHAEDAQARTAEDEGSETIAEPGALGTAGVALGAAAVAGYALDEAITRSHSETDHSSSDSLETHATLSAAEAEQEDEAVAAEAEDEPAPGPVPAFSDGEAPTWPDHPVVAFDEPALVEPNAAEAAVDEAAAASTFDVTDTTGVMEAVKPIADIEPEAAPLILALPALAAAGAFEAATQPGAGDDEALVEPADSGPDATDLYIASAAPASESADEVPLLLVPVEELDEPSFGRMPMVGEPVQPVLAAEAGAVPEEAYIPPTVPVVSAEPEVAAPPAYIADPVSAEAERPTGETLAELAAFAGAAGVGVAGAEALAHRYDEPAPTQPQPAQVAAEPVTDEPSPATVELPVTFPEPAAELAAPPPPEPETVPVIAAAAAAPIAAEAVAAEAVEPAPPRKQFRRIREYLQVKRGDQVVEELVAEEIVEVDADQEPIRQRLRAQLHQQAVERGLE